MNYLTRKQARQIDERAINQLGIPGIVLMENAGRNATELIQHYMKEQDKPLTSALIVCGGGNNGGDGYVVARHLHNRGVAVHILATKPIDQLTGDAKTNATICQNMNLPITPAPGFTPGLDSAPDSTTNPSPRRGVLQPAGASLNDRPTDIIIDALLGTGFQGTLRPDMLNLIQSINAIKTHGFNSQMQGKNSTEARGKPPEVIALDLPSGLDCDTGRPPEPAPSRQGERHNTYNPTDPTPLRRGVLQHAGPNTPNSHPNPTDHAIRADLTITFAAPKVGFTQPTAKLYLGQIKVADIGTPPELLNEYH